MSDTIRKKKKTKHDQTMFSCQISRATHRRLDELSEETGLPKSILVREQINKMIKVHKYAKKEVE